MSTLPSFSPRRALGRTGFVATAVGIGDIADRSTPREVLVATLTRALDAGLNVIDTAPNYEEGLSEEVVGEALRGRREGVFLIDKVDVLDAPVGPQVAASLKRLGHAHVDLFVFHAVSELSAWEALAAPGGGLAQLGECVRAGQARFRGISSHHPEVLRRAVLSGLCDVVMFPLGPFVDARYVEDVLPLARSRGVGVVSFKTFGAGKLLGDTEGYGRPLESRPRGKVGSGGREDREAPLLPHLGVEECVRYTLTLDPDVMLMGMSHPNEQDAALAAAHAWRPLTPEALEDVRVRARRAIDGKGAVWWNPTAA
ncbi:aldo/keto reductase [Myxococcus sp. MISCRS1]|uniref:aldo/keto reductase n=1 Tax=Myxococcus TaxID=32 RepID=UPI001CBB233A|nr:MULTISPECIES: aldo/keto reductase [unclassified Myxococcus]MBZ4395747.1 aldo/keto reductase [Myxococcus sp. AS-1-15]MBZ4411363.1 aldo/keto reductase [Myxococcus sp. XM-1-1-1]MCY0998890.1 aldo/keto reductase [Myxococcus sp. MISCRS1]